MGWAPSQQSSPRTHTLDKRFVRGVFVEGPLERLTTFSACTHAYTKFGFPTSPHVHVVGLWEEDGPSEESGERSGNG